MLSPMTKLRVAVVSALPRAVVCTVKGPGHRSVVSVPRVTLHPCLACGILQGHPSATPHCFIIHKGKVALRANLFRWELLRHENKAFELLHIN